MYESALLLYYVFLVLSRRQPLGTGCVAPTYAQSHIQEEATKMSDTAQEKHQADKARSKMRVHLASTSQGAGTSGVVEPGRKWGQL